MRFFYFPIFIVIFSGVLFASYADEQIVPEWVKNNAGWWANDQIPDSAFIDGIEFLIKDGIIVVSNTQQVESHANGIPEWVKNNAGWWANDQIPDSAFIDGIEFLIKKNIIVIHEKINLIKNLKEHDYNGYSPLFRTFAYEKDFIFIDDMPIPTELQFEFKSNMSEIYQEIKIDNDIKRAAVIMPIFTSSAYWEPGFYTYFRGECDAEFHGVLFRDDDCLTTDIAYGKSLGYSASSNAVKVLELLGYDILSDIDIDKNPEILNSYEKIIVLHNEYVTKKEFDAIISHPKVMFLYPNALYAEISFDQESSKITLIRGHNYPEITIRNGFEWEYENTHPYEFDNVCKDWSFYEIDYGVMLNCYPENIIFTDKTLLKMIKEF
jgi:hypothetical protein